MYTRTYSFFVDQRFRDLCFSIETSDLQCLLVHLLYSLVSDMRENISIGVVKTPGEISVVIFTEYQNKWSWYYSEVPGYKASHRYYRPQPNRRYSEGLTENREKTKGARYNIQSLNEENWGLRKPMSEPCHTDTNLDCLLKKGTFGKEIQRTLAVRSYTIMMDKCPSNG